MEYQEFKEKVIQAAAKLSVEEYELYYAEDSDVEVETLLEKVETFSTSTSAGVCFRCVIDGKMGYASTEVMEAEEAENIVRRAMENASLMENTDEVFLYDGAKSVEQKCKEKREIASSAVLIEKAVQLQKEMFAKSDKVTQSSQSVAESCTGTIAIYNSKGVDLMDSFGFDALISMAILSENDQMYQGFDYALGDVSQMDTKSLVDSAYQKGADTIGAKPVVTGNYNIIFKNRQMQALLAHYSVIFSAENVQKNLSLLKDKEEETIAAEQVTIIDDPMYEGGIMRRSFDDEGVPARRKEVISGGVLKTLLYDLRTAAKKGIESTGNAVKSGYESAASVKPIIMYMEKGEKTFEELLTEAGTGIVVTTLNGMHASADTTSGDFSLNAAGYYFENGKKQFPVDRITVAGNFYELLKNITAIADDLEIGIPRGGTTFGAPSVFVPNMPVAGVDAAE